MHAYDIRPFHFGAPSATGGRPSGSRLVRPPLAGRGRCRVPLSRARRGGAGREKEGRLSPPRGGRGSAPPDLGGASGAERPAAGQTPPHGTHAPAGVSRPPLRAGVPASHVALRGRP